MNQVVSMSLVVLGAVTGWVGTWITVTRLAPFGNEAELALAAFWLFCFLALAGTFILINWILRWGSGVSLGTLMRQGVILALLSLGFLALQHLQVLTWWDGILLVAIALLIEFLFSSREAN